MKRKILSALMCLALAFSLTGCFSDNEVSSTVPTPSPAITPDATLMPDTSSSSLDSEVSEMDTNGSLDAYAKAVKDAYSTDYIPDRKLTDSEVQEKLSLNTDLYDDIYAEGSTQEENPDIFIAVKAKSGKTSEVEKKLLEYREKLATDTAYSANVDKIKAGEIFSNGDHVFMILLGANEFDTAGENMADSFSSEMKKGVDAIMNMFS